MGLRGVGAKPVTVIRDRDGVPVQSKIPAWENPTLPRADKVIAFIESLRVTSGAHAGRPFLLREWQRAIIRAWYATGADGRRIVRTGLLTMGRKNGKTSLCAAIALAHLVGPEVEPRGQIVAAASDRDQSGLIFNELVAFLADNPGLGARCNVQRHAKMIQDMVSGSEFRALSSDAKKAHGLSPSVIILDELAQWGHGLGQDLYTALTTSTGARAEPLMLIISTQTDDEHALMSEQVDYGKQVASGAIQDPTFSAHIFEVPLTADHWDEATWPLANPALGDFRSREEMRTFAAKAKRLPTQARMFRLYYLNQRVQASDPWIPLEAWDPCALLGPEATPPPRRRVFLGLDLSTTMDMSALVRLFPNPDGTFDVRADFWCPAEQIEIRSQRDRVDYRTWVEQGFLIATPGPVVDYSVIDAKIREYMATYDVAAVAVDPWNAAGFIQHLIVDNIPAVKVEQTIRTLTSATKKVETLVGEGKLRHDGHPVLRWNVRNAIPDIDGNGCVKPSKKRSQEKIDGVSALVTGMALAILDEGPSVYETRGLLSV
jgi:phage terminase large subunit-like protein